MAALLDVNVLVALAFRTHVHHERALAWWRVHAAEGWATTPITEVGFVRVSSNSRALPDARTPAEAIGLLERMRTRRGHAFWPDDVTITGEGAVQQGPARVAPVRDRRASHRPRQATRGHRAVVRQGTGAAGRARGAGAGDARRLTAASLRGGTGPVAVYPPRAGIRPPSGPARPAPRRPAIGTQLAPRARRPRPATRARKRPPARKGSHQTRELVGLGLVALAIFLGVTLFLGLGIGPVGGWLEDALRLLVGRAVALMPLALIAVGIALILDHPLAAARPLRLGVALGAGALLIALAGGALGMGGGERTAWFDRESVSELGGYLGETGYWVTSSTVGDVGTGILVAGGLIAAVILISGASLGHVLRRSGRSAAVASRTVGKGVATATVTAIRSGQSLRERIDAMAPPTLAGRRRPPPARPLLDGADTFPDIFGDASALPPSPALGPDGGRPGPDAGLAPAARPPAGPRAAERDEGDGEIAPVFTPGAPARARDGGYRTPSATLLRRSGGTAAQPEELVARTSRILEETLGHFGIEAKVADTVSGPRVTRYELQLAPGTKVGRITALRDDLAYALAAREELRIIAPIPGKQAVGVEVPNPEAALVTLGDITREFPSHAGALMAWLGLDLGGKPVYVDLARMPHLLIAGSTGTGKSVCLNSSSPRSCCGRRRTSCG